jgi:Pectate lyase superfamily protein
MPKSIPQLGDSNWGTPLNVHLAQLQNPANGGINSFEQFSGRPTTLTADDAGKTYLYTQTGNIHQWNGTIWKVLNESVINVKDYGAVGDGVTDDYQVIQNCINNFNKIHIPDGTYLLRNTLKVDTLVDTQNTGVFFPSGKEIMGESKIHTILLRTPNNKTNLGQLTCNNGSIDDFNVNAVFAFTYESTIQTSFNNTISNLTIKSTINDGNPNNMVEYGFFAPRMGLFTIENIQMWNIKNGFYGHDCFLGIFKKINQTYGYSLFVLAPDSAGASGGTTLSLSDLSAQTSDTYLDSIGYDITGLHYSSFTNCSVDAHCRAYRFKNCDGITMNGCGAEVIKGKKEYSSMFEFLNSRMTLNSFRIVGPSANNFARETYYMLVSDTSKLIFNGCVFDSLDTTGGNNTYDILIGNDLRIISNFTQLPSGGKGTVIFDTSCIQINDGFDIKRQTASGTKTVQFV